MPVAPIYILNKLDAKKHVLFQIAFCIFALRVLFLILVPPFIGLANNGDFFRVLVPCGLGWPGDPYSPELYDDVFFYYVYPKYCFVEAVQLGNWRMLSEIFAKIAVFLSNRIETGWFDLRFMGLVNASLFLLVIRYFMRTIEKISGLISYIVLLFTIIVFGDSSIIQYFNSFYAEPHELIFTLLLWGLLLKGFLLQHDSPPLFKITFCVICFITAFFSCLSKQQDILVIFPVGFILYLLASRLFKLKWLATGFAVLFLLSAVIMFLLNPGAGNVPTFNVINTDLLAVSSYPESHLEKMGMNEDEIDLIQKNVGRNAFMNNESLNVENWFNACNRRNELKMICREPALVVRMAVVGGSDLFQDTGLGNYTADSGAIPGEKTQENRLWSMLKSKIYVRDFWFYAFVIFTSLLLCILGFNRLIPMCRKQEFYTVFALLPISNLIRFFSVIFGDTDRIKHFFMLNVEFDVIFLTCCVLIMGSLLHLLTMKNQQ